MRCSPSCIPLLSALVASTIAGCSLVGWGRPTAPPTLTLTASTVTSLDDAEIVATVVVTVSNPNLEPVRVGRIAYRLTFPGDVVSKGTVRVNSTVDGESHLDVELPVRIAVRRLLPTAAPNLLMGELPYELDASARVGTPLIGGNVRLKTSSALRLDLPLELVEAGPRRRPSPPGFAFAARDWQTK